MELYVRHGQGRFGRTVPVCQGALEEFSPVSGGCTDLEH